VLEGEAGIGKTTVWTAGIADAAARSYLVLSSRPTQSEAKLLRYDKWQDGTLRMTELQMFRLQHWSVHEFEALLAEAGFTDISVISGYQHACTAGPGDRDWTFHATAPPYRESSVLSSRRAYASCPRT
jgi:hypothetical protein